MADRPSKRELLEAVQGFIDRELIDHLDGVRRFHARVASNALGILGRELLLEGESLQRRHAALADLLGESRESAGDPAELSETIDAQERRLVTRIRSGDADGGAFRREVLDYLWLSVRERLAVNNPGYR